MKSAQVDTVRRSRARALGMRFVRKLIWMLIVLWGITVVSFFVIHLAPGTPTDMQVSLNPLAGDTVRERLNALYGLDRPLAVQYMDWLNRLVHLDFGHSLSSDGRPVIEKIAERLPLTVGMTVATLLLMLYFSIDLGWLPLSGLTSLNFATLSDTGKILDVARHLVLPILVGVVGGVAGTSRFLRSSMLEVLRQDYILTARAKGLPEHTVIFRHALRNALLPVITLLGLSVPGLIGGSVIIETIFALPGLGQLFYTAVMARDYPLIMGNLVLGATLTLLGNLLADLGYALADPRIRAGARSGGKGGGL